MRSNKIHPLPSFSEETLNRDSNFEKNDINLFFLNKVFKFFRKRIAGVMSHDKLLKITGIFLQIKFSDNNIKNDLFFSTIKNSPEWYREWLCQYSESLKNVANVSGKIDQALMLRQQIVHYLEISILSQQFMEKDNQERTDDEKIILRGNLNSFPEKDYEESLKWYGYLFFFSQVNIECLRYISIQFNDAKLNDWFFMYSDIYTQYIQHCYELIIAREKKECYIMEPFINILREMVNDAKDKISKGYNWNYDKEKYIKEQINKETEAKNLEPLRKKSITNHQVDDLSEYLFERYQRASKGELFKMGEYSTNNQQALSVIDTSIMLIALTECLEEKEAAIHAIKSVIYRFLIKIGANMDKHSVNQINIDEQLDFLRWQETKGGFLPDFCIIATYMMYKIDPDGLSEADKDKIARDSAGNLDHVWQVYAVTKNVFDFNYSISPFSD